MKVLVTGATGVYGRSVVERLHRAGHEVVAMARRPPKSLPAGVSFSQGDVAEPDDVRRAMAGCEVVAHLAFVVTPLKSEQESKRISVGGTRNVVEAMQELGARRLVFASSAMSYGANPDNPPLFTEEHEQRPAPDYVYGTDKKEAEQLIIESGVEAVMARTAVTVGRNIDNLLVDIFAAPAIIGVKGVDIRYQLIHQDDVGRFLALACEQGPPGPVNVAPPDFLKIEEIAEVLGKPYVELSEERVLKSVEFMWKHELADITPGEAAGISYLPRMATDRLREEWGFECAWTTAEGVHDLRRAVRGITVVAKRRIELPWALRFPRRRPGEVVASAEAASGRPAEPADPGELDTPVPLAHPTYAAATWSRAPLPALSLDVGLALLRAAATGALDAFGMPEPDRLALGWAGAGAFGHRLYLNEDVAAYAARAPRLRHRLLAAAYAREVADVAAGAASVLERATDPAGLSDARLEATLSVVLDELGWLWSAAAVGALLDGEQLEGWDRLLPALPQGTPAGERPGPREPSGRRSAPRAQAERTALALATALAAASGERARRLEAAGVLADAADAAHLRWEELLAAPDDAAELVARRRGEHERLAAVAVPATVSAVGPASAIATRAERAEQEEVVAG